MAITAEPAKEPNLATYLALLVVSIAAGLLASANLAVAAGLAALPLVVLAALVFFKRPTWALYAFILFLPFHSFVLILLIAQLNFSRQAVTLAASWKEALLVGTFLAVALRVLLSKRIVRRSWIDLAAVLWLALVLVYFLLPDSVFGWQSSLTARLYGARDWLLYLLPYFIGRLVAINDRKIRWILKAILFIGVLTSLVGIFDYLFIPLEWHVRLGVPRYFGDFLGLPSPGYLMGLPENYWTNLGPVLVRRAVSVYFSGQGFALSFLIVIPAAVYNYLARLTRHAGWILALCLAGLLLTITRTTIIVCLVQSLIVMWMMGRKKLTLRLLVLTLLAAGAVVLVSSNLRQFVINTLTFSDPSSSTRPAQWLNGIRALFQYPFGFGLGSTGQTGARFGIGGTGTEAGYFKLTGALGLLGLALFLAWFAGILYSARRVQRESPSAAGRGLAVVTFAIAAGFLLNNLTAPPDQAPFVIYVFAWLAGSTVQLSLRRQPDEAPANPETGFSSQEEPAPL